MIVPMKKAYVVVQESRRTKATEELAELGLVQVSVDSAESEQLEELKKQQQNLEKAIAALPAESAKSAEETLRFDGKDSAIDLAHTIIGTSERLRELRDQQEKIQREIDRIAVWGNFNPADIIALKKAGVSVSLRVMTQGEYADLPEDVNAWICQRRKKTLYVFVASNTSQEMQIGQEFLLPSQSMNELVSQLKNVENSALEQLRILEKNATSISQLQKALELVQADIEFETVRAGMQEDGQLCVIHGFIPASDITSLKEAARKNAWAVAFRDPQEEENPPTYVKNPRWIRIIQPVFDFLGTVPGYRELDISGFFLLFFVVFFGMIISDAGYGSILLTVAVLFSAKSKIAKGKIPDALLLFVVLSFATVVWGAITGNWFGYAPIADMKPFSYFVIDAMDSFEVHSVRTVQLFCFVLGGIHLSIAFLWNAKRALSSQYKLKAFAELGWLSMLAGLFFLVLNVVLGAEDFPLPSFSMPLIISGFAAVTIFSEQEGNFFKGIGKGIAGLMTNALDSISRFSDIISYIRLFAVGLASLAIAQSFNAMGMGLAEGIGGNGGLFAGGLVIFMGHTINLMMAGLSVVVHGVRLNMLEFSGALGMEWTGQLFRPFRAYKE